MTDNTINAGQFPTVAFKPTDFLIKTLSDGTLEKNTIEEFLNSGNYKIIPVDFDFSNIPPNYDNSIWEIRYMHNLGGNTINLPENVTLYFRGGVFSNGNINGQNTSINSTNTKIFNLDINTLGTWNVYEVFPEWFGALGNGDYDDIDAINKSITFVNNGKLVFTKSKTYIVSESIKLNKSIFIEGNNSIIKLKTGTYDSISLMITTFEDFIFDNPRLITIDNLKIQNLIFDVNNVSLTGVNSGINGLFVRDCKNLSISGVKVVNMPLDVQQGYGVAVCYCDFVEINDIGVESSGRQNLLIWESLNVNVSNVFLNGSYSRDCILVSTNTPIVYQETKKVNINNATLVNDLGGVHIMRVSGFAKEVNISNINLKSNNIDTNGLNIFSPTKVNISNMILECKNAGVFTGNDDDKFLSITNSYIKADNPIETITDMKLLKVSNTTMISTNDSISIANVQFIDDVTFNDCIFDGGLEIKFFQFLNLSFNNNIVKNNKGLTYSMLAIQPSSLSKGVVSNNLGVNLTSPLFRIDVDNGVSLGNRVNVTGSIVSLGESGFNNY